MELHREYDGIIGASIVTYNPNITRLEQNILGIFNNSVYNIIIVDNGSGNLHEIMALSDRLGKGKFTIINNRKNMGIARALNQALDNAYIKGYKWLLTLDQDSICSSGYISAMSEYFRCDCIGLIYPKTHDSVRSSAEKTKISRIQSLFHSYNKMKNPSIISMPITSGSLINISAGIKCGGFTDCFFIDSVDFDFNLKLSEHNFEILKCEGAVLYHALGNPVGRYFLGVYFIATGHPAWRYYYISRNAWLLRHNHTSGIQRKWCNKNLIRTISPLRILYIYTANNFNFKFIKCILKGHYDGIFKKLRQHDEILKKLKQ